MWDYLVIACWVVFLVVVGVVARAWSPSGAPDVSVLGADALAFSLTVCPVWLYLTASEAGRTHATWGKRRAGLHVVTDLHGGPVSLSRAALRNAVKLLPWQLAHVAVARMILGVDRPVLVVTTYSLSMVLVVTTVIVAWRDPRHRAFHDLVAGTRVVNVRASVG